MIGPEDWESDRDDAWESISDEAEAHGIDRDEWEEQQDIEDYGLTNEDMDSGDSDW